MQMPKLGQSNPIVFTVYKMTAVIIIMEHIIIALFAVHTHGQIA